MREILNKNNPTKDVCEIESEGESAPSKSSDVKLGTTFVSAHCWATAKAQTTASGMARMLLMGPFQCGCSTLSPTSPEGSIWSTPLQSDTSLLIKRNCQLYLMLL